MHLNHYFDTFLIDIKENRLVTRCLNSKLYKICQYSAIEPKVCTYNGSISFKYYFETHLINMMLL